MTSAWLSLNNTEKRKHFRMTAIWKVIIFPLHSSGNRVRAIPGLLLHCVIKANHNYSWQAESREAEGHPLHHHHTPTLKVNLLSTVSLIRTAQHSKACTGNRSTFQIEFQVTNHNIPELDDNYLEGERERETRFPPPPSQCIDKRMWALVWKEPRVSSLIACF